LLDELYLHEGVVDVGLELARLLMRNRRAAEAKPLVEELWRGYENRGSMPPDLVLLGFTAAELRRMRSELSPLDSGPTGGVGGTHNFTSQPTFVQVTLMSLVGHLPPDTCWPVYTVWVKDQASADAVHAKRRALNRSREVTRRRPGPHGAQGLSTCRLVGDDALIGRFTGDPGQPPRATEGRTGRG
jgi:hypothetical protein